jgi:hypothetical protein
MLQDEKTCTTQLVIINYALSLLTMDIDSTPWIIHNMDNPEPKPPNNKKLS